MRESARQVVRGRSVFLVHPGILGATRVEQAAARLRPGRDGVGIAHHAVVGGLDQRSFRVPKGRGERHGVPTGRPPCTGKNPSTACWATIGACLRHAIRRPARGLRRGVCSSPRAADGQRHSAGCAAPPARADWSPRFSRMNLFFLARHGNVGARPFRPRARSHAGPPVRRSLGGANWPSCPLKKGTGTSRERVLAGARAVRLGASPLFQRTPSATSVSGFAGASLRRCRFTQGRDANHNRRAERHGWLARELPGPLAATRAIGIDVRRGLRRNGFAVERTGYASG